MLTEVKIKAIQAERNDVIKMKGNINIIKPKNVRNTLWLFSTTYKIVDIIIIALMNPIKKRLIKYPS